MSMLTATWTKLSSSDKLKRSSQSVASVNGMVFIFGGELVARQPRDNDVLELQTSMLDRVQKAMLANQGPDGSATSIPPETSTSKPPARVGATMTALHGKLYVFSGRGGIAMAPIDESGSMQVFDVKTSSWSTISPADSTAAVPEARSYHCATTDGKSRIFIHAGCPEKGRLKDLWSFDVESCTWTQLPDAPGPQRGGSSITHADGKLWRMNGFDGQSEIGGTVEVFDVDQNTWSTIEYSADGQSGPGARSVSSLLATSIQGKTHLVTMFGEADPSSLGHAGAGKMLSDAWAFDTHGRTWKKLEAETTQTPEPRGWYDATVVDQGKIAVTGGLADSNERIADAWLLTVS